MVNPEPQPIERIKMADGATVQNLWQLPAVQQAVAETLQVNLQAISGLGEPQIGYGSSGAAVLFRGEPVAFLRVPQVDQQAYKVKDVITAYSLSGSKRVKAVWAIDAAGNVVGLPNTEIPSKEERENLEKIISEDTVATAQLLELLPKGKSLTQLVAEGDTQVTSEAYAGFGQALRQLHEEPLNLDPNEQEYWERSKLHVIKGRERRDDVEKVVWPRWQTLMPDLLSDFTHLMIAVASETFVARGDGTMMAPVWIQPPTTTAEPRLTRIHGDAWRENILVTDEGEIILFDHALAVGYPGYDVAFGFGDQLIRYLALGQQDALDNVNAFLAGYGEGQELDAALKEAFAPFGFKLMVGAAFDGYSESIQKQLLVLAAVILEQKNQVRQARLEIDQVIEAWHKIGGAK